jgi:amidase
LEKKAATPERKPSVNTTELCFTPATELAGMIRGKKISPLELTQAVLDRIETLNPKINAYCTLVPESALQTAREAEGKVLKGEMLGPLHGIPLSIKDLMPTEGIRTTWGSRYHKDFVPREDGLLVQRLKAAGAVILGKTNTPEFGIGINTTNKLFGTTLNPWDRSRTAGGSSGGAAAALAAGLGPLAHGSDLGGSLRIPASFCGVIGFRPSPGIIPKYPNYWAWDCFSVQGPMARTVSDTALMLSAMAGLHDRDPLSVPVDFSSLLDEIRRDYRGRRVAWSPDLGGLCPVEPEVIRICQAAAKKFEELGCTLEEASPDFSDIMEIIQGLRIVSSVFNYAQLLGVEDGIDNQYFKQFLNLGQKTSIAELAVAERKRTALWLRTQAFFERYDLLLCPTTSVPPFPADRLFPSAVAGKSIENRIESYLLTYAFSMVSVPAVSVPAGWTANNLPVGLQIVGKRLADAEVLKAAASFERIAPWAGRRPSV